MTFFKRFLVLLLTTLVTVQPALAESPIIWGPNNTAKALNSGELSAFDGNLYPKTGEKNYVTSPSAATGWGTGGTAVTATTDTTILDLPRALTSKTGIKITGTSGATGYAYYDMALDTADYGKKLKVQFEQNATLGIASTYVAGDFKVDVWTCTVAWASGSCSGTSARAALSTDSSAISALPALSGTYRTAFDASSGAPFVELRIGQNATSTHSIVVSDVVVGPGVVVQGAALSPEAVESGLVFNAQFGSTPTSKGIYSRRVGDKWQVRGTVLTSGTIGASALAIALPPGIVIDSARFSAQANAQSVGWIQRLRVSGAATQVYTLRSELFYDGSDTANVYVALNEVTSAPVQYDKTVGTALLVTGDVLNFYMEIPVAAYAGSGTVNVVSNDVQYAFNSSTSAITDSTSFGYGPGGVLFQAFAPAGLANVLKRVRFQSPLPAGVTPTLEILPASSTLWVKAAEYGVSYGINAAATAVWGYIVNPVAGSSTDYDIAFYATFDQAPGHTWSGLSTYKWRLSAGIPGQAIGFSEVVPGVSAGLVGAAGLKGSTSGSAACTGCVGERITCTNAPTGVTLTTNVAVDLCSIILTPGSWILGYSVEFENAPTGGTRAFSFIGTVAGNNLTGFAGGTLSTVDGVAMPTASANVGQAVYGWPVLVAPSTTATQYLKSRMNFTGGSATSSGTLFAIRQ